MGLGGCDVSQKKPETAAASLVTQHTGEPPAAVAAHARPERSIRLYGPGVSRQRQTRI